MKQFFLTALLALASLWASAQTSVLDHVFDRFTGKQGCTSVTISSSMFRLFSTITENSTDEDVKNMNQITDQLTGLKILTCPGNMTDGNKSSKDIYTMLKMELPLTNFETLMEIKEEGERVEFLVRKKDGKIQELVMLALDPEEVSVIQLTGSITLSDLSKLSKSMSIDGLENLDKVNKAKPTNSN